MKELFVKKNEAGQRLDKLLIKLMPNAPKSFIYKMIRKKNITLNDRKCIGNEIIQLGDNVKLWLSDDTFGKFSDSINVSSVNESIDLIYEDKDIIIYNKPAGMLSQKSKPTDISVNDILISYLLEKNEISQEDLLTFKPSICNRLDRNTSGIIICGKTLKGLQDMSLMLKERSIHKDYIAIVEGEVRSGDTLKGYIIKDSSTNKVMMTEKGDYIETEYKPVWTDGVTSVLMVRLITGKTHQIRLHLSSIGHPILGDKKYGSGKSYNRQLLHAYRVTFPDGRTYTAELPEDMKWALGKPEDFEDLPLKI